jgi:hypothetical protein
LLDVLLGFFAGHGVNLSQQIPVSLR